jgi:hypothetical protein
MSGRFLSRGITSFSGQGPDDKDITASLAKGSTQDFMRAVQEVVDSEGESGKGQLSEAYRKIKEEGGAEDLDIADRTLREMGVSVSDDGNEVSYEKENSTFREGLEIAGMSLLGPQGAVAAGNRLRRNIFSEDRSTRIGSIVDNLGDIEDLQTSDTAIKSVSQTLGAHGLSMNSEQLTEGGRLDTRSIARRVRGMSEEELEKLKEDDSSISQLLQAAQGLDEDDNRWNDIARELARENASAAQGTSRAKSGDLEELVGDENDFYELFYKTNQTNSELVSVMQENRDVLEELKRRM